MPNSFFEWHRRFDLAEHQRMLSAQYEAMRHLAQQGNVPGPWSPIMPPERYVEAPMALPTADTMGPIRAWRMWTIKQERLWSIAYSNIMWAPGKPIKAESGPGQRDTTGVHAVKARDYKFSYTGDTILGEVGLWGKVIEHELGFRAEYAYPIRLLWTAPKAMPGFPRPVGELRRLQALAEVYGVPLSVEETP